jgi:dipeptidyl aminopeptidase/acylaminoacyl peptidase
VADRPESPQILPFGSWPTPVRSDVVIASAVGLSEVRVDGEDVIWSESRPGEGGRVQLVRRSGDGSTVELLPAGQSARTAVHEYGGAAWWVRDGVVWFSAWEDQRLYRLEPDSGSAVALTPEPATARGDRYADGEVSPDGRWIVCIREHHPPDGRGAADVRNEIVRLHASAPSEPEVLVSGPDFTTSPRWSPDGERLCWLEWDHPNMPWDGTRLVVRELATGDQRVIAGGEAESVQQPYWQSDGSLTFLSDRSGWWNLYRWAPGGGGLTALVEIEAEIGLPEWVLGGSRYASLPDGRIVFARLRDGIDGLAIRLADGTVHDLELPVSDVEMVRAAGERAVVVVAGSHTAELSVQRIELDGRAGVREVEVVRPARELAGLGVERGYIAQPEPLDFPSEEGRTAHALLYAPSNPACTGPEGELPPLLVLVHGGPTGAAHPVLQLGVQYWTTRGFAVLDVNYGGSFGYGRAYRKLLRGRWGEVDVADCIAGARWVAEHGRCDPDRMCIRGGSAGGFTTLAALAREDTPFAAGASRYGVADLEALLNDTHKFESHDLENLVGPYPQERARYLERSPIHHVDAFSRPLIVLQGLEDAIVPPSQSEMIVDALRAKGVPVAYIAFEGEQHGFRRAENIRRSLDAELSFYAQVLGFELPAGEEIEPVEVENLPTSRL